jgi:enoyl-CoA hydratase/carnithine racemase
MPGASVRSQHEGGVATLMIDREAKRNALDRVLDLVLTGRQIDAAEAKQLGLVSRVVEANELDDEIARLTATLLAFSPSALRLGKEAVYTLCEMEYQTSMRYLREMIVRTSRTEDTQEGIRAFFEKRKPVWTGR